MDAKQVAAVAGVLRYLARHSGGAGRAQTRAAGGQAEQAGQAPAGTAAFGPPGPGPWALYGRQAQMNQRIRMQARRGR